MSSPAFVLFLVLGAPMLLLALAGWLCASAFRNVCAAVARRPIESEWDALPCLAEPQTQPRPRPAPCAYPWLLN